MEELALVAVDDALVGAEVEDALELLLGQARPVLRNPEDAQHLRRELHAQHRRSGESSFVIQDSGTATARATATGEAAATALGIISAKMNSVMVEKRMEKRTAATFP